MPLCIMSPLPLDPPFLQWCNGIWLKTIVTSVDYHEEGAPNICTTVVNENALNFTEFMEVLSTFAVHFNDDHLVIISDNFFSLYCVHTFWSIFGIFMYIWQPASHIISWGCFYIIFLLHFLISSPVVIWRMNIHHLTNTNIRQMKFSAVKQ